jgi:diguanylate cyclase (GGDEF)-like protein/PAS domain S-box-containing protein
MTSWNRRLSAAAARPGIGEARTSRTEVLADAVAVGVIEEDLSALMAMANVARDRPGFRSTLDVRARHGDDSVPVEFEILYDPSGPLVRPTSEYRAVLAGAASGDSPPAPPEPAAPTAPAAPTQPTDATAPPPADADADTDDEDADESADVVEILTSTLVETPDLVAIFASVGHEALWANDAFVTVIPIRESDKIWFVELLDEWSKGHYEVKVLPALVKYGRWRGRLTLIAGEDVSMHVSAVVVAHRDRRGEIEAISLVARDMSEIRGLDGGELVSGSRFAALVENAADVIAVLSPAGIVEYASPAATRTLSPDSGVLEGADLLALIHPDDRPSSLLSLARPDEQGIGAPVELRVAAADGGWRHLEVVVTDLSDNPAIGGIVLNARDVTERVAAVSALAAKAHTDLLTGLPGRVKLLDRVAAAIRNSRSQLVLVLLIDVDRVKNVNDLLGRDAGDEILRTVARRLEGVISEDMFLARLGGDEFVIVLEGVAAADAVELADNLRSTLAEPMEVAGGAFDVTASIGIASAVPGNDLDPESLLNNAERAMAQAKEAGGNRLELFTDQMAQVVSRRRTVEQTLRHALDHDGVRVHYQPIVDIETEGVVAAEALLRVHNEDGALLSPAEFIEAAESTGLIARLGSQVLLSTCEQLAAWSLNGAGSPAEISVNISPRQLADPNLAQHVVRALESAGVAPEHLWLEITESILIGAQPTIDASISYLRALGVRIGLDDFGAGQSSLGYLKRFPLDFVKIDRSLIAGLGVNEHDTAIVRATVELAHNLGLIVVAVGVETDVQLEYLQHLGCDRAQGYHFAPALPADQFAASSG